MARKLSSPWSAAGLMLALIPMVTVGPAFAAGSTGTIELRGIVPVQCGITVQNVDGQLDLVHGEVAAGEGQADFLAREAGLQLLAVVVQRFVVYDFGLISDKWEFQAQRPRSGQGDVTI